MLDSRVVTCRSVGFGRLSVLVGLGLASLALYSLLLPLLAELDSATPTQVERIVPAAQLLALPSPLLEGLPGASRPERHAAAAPLFVLIVTALFLPYLVGVRLASRRRSPAARNLIVLFAVLFQLTALASPTMLSTDVYSYIFYGRMFGVYHGNPYVEVPAQYPGDPFLATVYWKYVPSFYGPLWTLLSGLFARLAGDDLALAVLAFRGSAAAALAAAVMLVVVVLERIARQWTLSGALLLGWNPLVVIEAGLSGHNDVQMVLAVVAAFALAVCGRPALALGALTLGGLIKFTVLAAVPLLGLFLLRREPAWRSRALMVARAGVLCTALAAAILAPVWAGPETFAAATLGTGADRYTNALAELALGELRVWMGETRDDTEVPLQFRGWWIGTHMDTSMHERRDERSGVVRAIGAWTGLLVIGPERGGWMRVYDPETRRAGYVRSAAVGPIDRPAEYDDDLDLRAREQGPVGSVALQEANRLIRLTGLAVLSVVGLLALAAGTGWLPGVAQGWMAVLMAFYYVGTSWFWPWYLVWGLATAALAPWASISRWMVLLSWGAACLYGALGFGETELWWVQTYRSLAVFGAPLALLWADGGARLLIRGWRRARARAAHKQHQRASVGSGL